MRAPDGSLRRMTDHGISRRSLLSRSATGVGIALTGNLTGLFGTGAAGLTFSRDKQTLFANVQSPGHVFAIEGPFRKQR
jgi:secreted PhoX family phosphatase